MGRTKLQTRRWRPISRTTGDAILFFPSGSAGPAFLVTRNFIVLKQYNNSDAYALAVAHLSDRLRGLGPIRTHLAGSRLSTVTLGAGRLAAEIG